jgi:hypothetical protein
MVAAKRSSRQDPCGAGGRTQLFRNKSLVPLQVSCSTVRVTRATSLGQQLLEGRQGKNAQDKL